MPDSGYSGNYHPLRSLRSLSGCQPSLSLVKLDNQENLKTNVMLQIKRRNPITRGNPLACILCCYSHKQGWERNACLKCRYYQNSTALELYIHLLLYAPQKPGAITQRKDNETDYIYVGTGIVPGNLPPSIRHVLI